MKNTILAPLLIFMLLLMVPVALAQPATNADTNDWQGLDQLKSGKRILVETKLGGVIEGKFVSASGSKLTVIADGAIHTLERSDIQRIYHLKKRWSRKTTAFIGAVVGLFVSIPIATKIDSDNSESVAFPAAVYGIAGGAGLGYLLGGNRIGKLLFEAK